MDVPIIINKIYDKRLNTNTMSYPIKTFPKGSDLSHTSVRNDKSKHNIKNPKINNM